MTLRRVHFTCRRCGANAHPSDGRLGVDGLVSPHAQRLICFAGVDRSFEGAAQSLRTLAGLNVCDNTVREVCDRHGGLSRTWQREGRAACRDFEAASGAVEFQTDGTCVNTTRGWREIRLSIFAKREPGRPVVDLDAWDGQRLPEPTARVAAAAIRTGQALGPQWRRAAARLGIGRADRIAVLADGAKWIWKEVERNLPGATGVLDFYHATEYLHAAAHAIHGGDGAAATALAEGRRRSLLESGADGVLAGLPGGPPAARDLAAYLEPHRGHTDYLARLKGGPPDRQRDGGGGLQDGHRQAAEADRGEVEVPPGRASGGPLLPPVQPAMGRLLATSSRLTTGFHYRTPPR